jgi:hypothetical protein
VTTERANSLGSRIRRRRTAAAPVPRPGRRRARNLTRSRDAAEAGARKSATGTFPAKECATGRFPALALRPAKQGLGEGHSSGRLPGATTRDSHSPLRSLRRRASFLPLFLITLAVLGGCAFEEHRESLGTLARQGAYEEAAAALDRARAEGLYDESNELLYHLDRGAIALYLGDEEQAFERFDDVETLIERNFTRSVSRDLSSYLLNDRVLPYAGEPYEDQYANVFKLLIQLMRGNIVGGATVEARRLIEKTDLQRQRYVQLVQKFRDDPELSDELDEPGGTGVLVEEQEEGRFLESTLGTYLSVLTWTLAGEYDFQQTAARRLESAMELQEEFMPRVDADAFDGLDRLDRADLDLLLVIYAGQGPSKRAETLRAGWGKYGTKIEWPALVVHPSQVKSVVIRIDDDPPVELPMVENMAAAAAETYRRQLPLIRAKALGRAIFKSIARYAIIETAEDYHRDRRRNDKDNVGDDLLLIGSHVLGFLISETEQADLRYWAAMPGQAYVGTFDLPAGEHRVEVEYRSRSGGVLGRPKVYEVTVEPGRMAVVASYKPR